MMRKLERKIKSGIKRTLAKGKEMMVKTENTTLENLNYFMGIIKDISSLVSCSDV